MSDRVNSSTVNNMATTPAIQAPAAVVTSPPLIPPTNVTTSNSGGLRHISRISPQTNDNGTSQNNQRTSTDPNEDETSLSTAPFDVNAIPADFELKKYIQICGFILGAVAGPLSFVVGSAIPTVDNDLFRRMWYRRAALCGMVINFIAVVVAIAVFTLTLNSD